MDHINLLDTDTPLNAVLSAKYKRTYAYVTVSERLPKILQNIIEYMAEYETDIINEFGLDARQDLVYVHFALILLQKAIIHNNALLPFLTMNRDVPKWNHYLWQQQLQSSPGEPSWFTASWLYAECYFYRSIHQIFQNTLSLTSLDPFAHLKMQETEKCKTLIISTGEHISTIFNNEQSEDNVHEHFIHLLKLSLWGNKYDLSSPAIGISDTHNEDFCETLHQHVLVDNSELVWEALKIKHDGQNTVNFVNDNAGYELFCDCCLADFMLTFGLADEVCFHFKVMPWFISDAVFADFLYLMHLMAESGVSFLNDLYIRWQDYVYGGKWVMKNEIFWTLPHVYQEMEKCDHCLYAQLQSSKLTIFKGDVNYRKLLAETKCLPSESFSSVLKNFHPANLVSLRTIKSEVICGLNMDLVKELYTNEPDWMLIGKYAVIQFDSPQII